MTAEHPNWVAEREKCNMAALWSDVRDIVHVDVRRKNEEEAKQKTGVSYAFPVEEQSPTQARIQCSNQAGDLLGSCRVAYNVKTQKIEVTICPPAWARKADTTGVLMTRWDAEDIQCRVVVTMTSESQQAVEFPHDHLWKVVQYFLEPFFFPVLQKGDG